MTPSRTASREPSHLGVPRERTTVSCRPLVGRRAISANRWCPWHCKVPFESLGVAGRDRLSSTSRRGSRGHGREHPAMVKWDIILSAEFFHRVFRPACWKCSAGYLHDERLFHPPGSARSPSPAARGGLPSVVDISTSTSCSHRSWVLAKAALAVQTAGSCSTLFRGRTVLLRRCSPQPRRAPLRERHSAHPARSAARGAGCSRSSQRRSLSGLARRGGASSGPISSPTSGSNLR